MNTVLVYIGLGSNLDDPKRQIKDALNSLRKLSLTNDGVEFSRVSSLYRSAPLGPQDQPDFINTVAELLVALDPLALLNRLQQLEQEQGRVEGRRWGERIIDLDIILYGDGIVESAMLTIPHIGIAKRAFVLLPLAEIVGGELDIPGVGTLTKLLEECDCGQVNKL